MINEGLIYVCSRCGKHRSLANTRARDLWGGSLSMCQPIQLNSDQRPAIY